MVGGLKLEAAADLSISILMMEETLLRGVTLHHGLLLLCFPTEVVVGLFLRLFLFQGGGGFSPCSLLLALDT